MSLKIIAEAGSNHNGKIDLAYQLVDIAKNANADYVKFQLINPKTLYVPYYWDGEEKVNNMVFQRRNKECLSYDEWRLVYKYSEEKGIKFTASVFDIESVDFLVELGVPFIKLASSDLNNKALISYIAKKGVPLIISTGMANIDEIKASVETYTTYGDIENLTVLHCVSVYPCALENTLLHKINLFKKELNCNIGFSDHTLNSKAAIAATVLGVKFVEKHYTLDKSMDGFDHLYASDPEEFKEYVKDLRLIEQSLNSSVSASTGEEVTKVRARRGVYLNKPLKKGDVISENDLVALRPTNELNPFELDKLIGIKLAEDIREYEPMKLKDSLLFPDENSSWKSANNYWKNEMKEKKML